MRPNVVMVASVARGDEEVKVMDNVNHPAHYGGAIECIEYIQSALMDVSGVAAFCLGNAIKYIGRAGHKDDIVQDLEKAKWYLEREIERLKNK